MALIKNQVRAWNPVTPKIENVKRKTISDGCIKTYPKEKGNTNQYIQNVSIKISTINKINNLQEHEKQKNR